MENKPEKVNQEQGTASSPYCVNMFPADSTGCDFYRNFCPRETVEHCIGDVTFNTCRKFMVDMNFFKGVNVNILQRQVSNAQCEYYLKFIIPMSRKCGSWIVYNIDDCIHKDDIPTYNKAWEVYQSDEYMENIRRMLNASDFVLVTTDELGQYYQDRFGVAKESVVVIPNYVPYWWAGHYYNIDRIMRSYEKHVEKAHKPRVALIGAPAHYDINGKGVRNDASDIAEYIRKTVKDYTWIIFGSTIPEIDDLIQSKQVEYYRGIDILHYPDMLTNLEIQYVVAPLVDNVFNRCKSNIKLTESWALGMGCAGQDICTYNKYTDDVFKDMDGLDAILKRDLGSADAFKSKIEANRAKMDGWWLEGHIGEWVNLYHLRQKPLIFNYDQMVAAKNSAAQQPQQCGGIVAPNISIPDAK